MIINLNWRDLVKIINGPWGVDGLNTGYGLGMTNFYESKNAEGEGAAFWCAGNCRIWINSWEDNKSLIELRPEDEQIPADVNAKDTWEKLFKLLAKLDDVSIQDNQVIRPVFSKRATALNQLAVLWVNFNQTARMGKNDDKADFLKEHSQEVGLPYISISEFNKHLVKAYKAGIIDKDKNTGRYVPKLAT
jgi:hypothetical protein